MTTTNPLTVAISGQRCPVPPADYGSEQWIADRKPLVDAFTERKGAETAEADADDYLWRHCDAADLRALGFCRQCGAAITLRQIGRCVYGEPCDHFRAQGELRKMLPFVQRRRAKITDERKAALLALIGR